jgi:uncharacterized SAM-binding protein YcdF (DUF218 family)
LFFFFAQALAFFLEPINHIFALALLTLTTARRWRVIFASALFGYVLIFAYSPVPTLLLAHLENQFATPKAPLPSLKNAVVLSGGTVLYDTQDDRFEWLGSSDRILEAIRLYKKGHVERLIISGGDPVLVDGLQTENPSMAHAAKDFGVPETSLILEAKSLNTAQNAQMVADLMKVKFSAEEYGDAFYLVTSAAHMPRAMKIFAKLGLNPVPYPVDFETPFDNRSWFASSLSLSRLRYWRGFLHEQIGLWVYEVYGYAK